MTKHMFMPALSPTMEKGTLARWLITPGTAFKAGDVIAEVETDKATMEVEAPEDGVLVEILVSDGAEDVPVNTPIGLLADGVDATAPTTRAAPEAAPAPRADTDAEPILSPAAKRVVVENGLDVAAIEGSGRRGRITKGDALAAAAADPRAPSARKEILVSPLARRIAEQMGVDLAVVTGTGPQGRIVKTDIVGPGTRQVPAHAVLPAPAPSATPRAPPPLEQMGVPPGSYELVPLDGMRRTVARRMMESFRDIPHFPLSLDIELDALLAVRARINGGLPPEAKVSLNDFVIKAAAAALLRVPGVNASYTPEGLALHRHADIAMAVAIDGGLITPIVRAAERKGVAGIAAETKDLADRARRRKLRPEEFQGGTFSISNLGMFDIRTFTSIINEPHGAILSVGAGEKRPVVKDGNLAIATMMTVTLTCDHRVLDGVVASQWLSVFKGLLEDPITMIA